MVDSFVRPKRSPGRKTIQAVQKQSNELIAHRSKENVYGLGEGSETTRNATYFGRDEIRGTNMFTSALEERLVRLLILVGLLAKF